ncbi:MAG: ImmA/IrrE family metallo-endopeptidase [Bradyrhizobium sp.]|jgi:Zn-dependent peptidase ImmA (M78 family)
MVNRHHLEDEDIELIAREARRVLGIEFVPSPDMLTAVFKAVHLRLIKNYVRVPDADMPDDLAAFDPDNGLLSLQESTFVAANEVVSCPPERTRARFTIAHEFGHVFLGHKRTRHRNVSGRPIERMAAPIIRDERDADRFAGAFLAPAHLIENPLLLSARSIGDRFGLGSTASTIRLETLERMYRRAHNIPRPIPDSVYRFLEDAAKRGAKVVSVEAERKRRTTEAKARGYADKPCPECGNFTLVRNGTRMKCDTCGSTTGCS